MLLTGSFSFWVTPTLNTLLLTPLFLLLLLTITFCSDVHGNLPALEAVLADTAQYRPDMIFCLGDLMGYAPWSNQVGNKVGWRGIPTLAGDCDEGRAGQRKLRLHLQDGHEEELGDAAHCLHK